MTIHRPTKGTIASLKPAKELANVDTGTISSLPAHQKALTVKDIGVAFLFGFVDGFLGGMVTDVKEGWKDGHVKIDRRLAKSLNIFCVTQKHLWHAIKKLFTGKYGHLLVVNI